MITINIAYSILLVGCPELFDLSKILNLQIVIIEAMESNRCFRFSWIGGKCYLFITERNKCYFIDLFIYLNI